MFKKIKSAIIGAGLVLDYMYDNAHRVITGLPRINRSQITPHLFLGSQYNLLGLKKLKALGVTAIVNMRMHDVYGDAAHQGIKYLHLPTVDNTPPPIEVLIKGADFMDNEIKHGGSVYVHCRQGLGRGPSMAIAYLIKTGLTYKEAYAMVRKVRIFINPRPGQIKRLKELEAYYDYNPLAEEASCRIGKLRIAVAPSKIILPLNIFTGNMPPAKPENIDWISNLRLIALYAVIILHSTSVLLMQHGKVSNADWLTADFLNALVRFAVPVFVMITGALLLHREYEPVNFLKKRLSRVVVPFLFWSLVYIWYSWYIEEITFGADAWANIKEVLHFLKYGSSYHLWYVYMLIGLYFIIPIIGKFVRHATEREILYFLVVWFAVMLITQPYLVRVNPSVDMHYFAGYIGYLVLGHYLAFKNFETKNLRGWMIALFIFSIAIITVGTWYIAPLPKWPGTMFYEPVNPAVLTLSASIFMVVKLTVPKVSPGVIQIRDFVGKYNYGIYLGHALILYFLDDPFGVSYKLCTPIISIPLTALICFIVTLFMVWLVNKIPFIGKWISG